MKPGDLMKTYGCLLFDRPYSSLANVVGHLKSDEVVLILEVNLQDVHVLSRLGKAWIPVSRLRQT